MDDNTYNTLPKTRWNRVSLTFTNHKKEMSERNPKTIYEIGPSYGETSNELLNLFPHAMITAVEYDGDLFGKLLEEVDNSRFSAYHGDGFNPSSIPEMQGNTYDLIFAMNNLYYTTYKCEKDELVPIYRELTNLLNVGGWFCLSMDFSYMIIEKTDTGYEILHEYIGSGSAGSRKQMRWTGLKIRDILSEITDDIPPITFRDRFDVWNLNRKE